MDPFRELANNLEELFWIADLRGWRFHYTSPAYERVFGRPRANLEKVPSDWTNAIHPEDRAGVFALLRVPLEERREHTFRVIHPDASIHHLRTSYFPIRDEASGGVVRIAGITRDVTDQLELEAQLQQAQKIESLGMLAGGVAHDFNNILAVISSSIGMLASSVPPDDRDLVVEIEKAVTRGSSLTRQLLAFSRRQGIRPVVVDLNRVVDDTRKMLRRLVGDTIRLTSSLDPELRSVFVDPGSMVQVVMNLAVNARDAMPVGGALSIVTRNIASKLGPEVLLEVADTGSGIPPDLQARVFEPFFTTKAAGKGTGLGLSVVHGIVRQAGGRIELESEVGRGTTFRIFFPIATGVPATAETEHADPVDGHERILLVDDDPYVRASAAKALRGRGYDVFEATDGEQALDILQREAGAVSLLVTDVVMPNMDGRQLVEAARAIYPCLKVLYTTGYTDDAVLSRGVVDSEVALIEKPFRTYDLARRVRHIIDA